MKRIISFILCFVCLIGFASCDESTFLSASGKIIAVEYGSPAEDACENYVSDGYTKVTYNSSSDVVLAVENKKADCGIVDEFELNSYINAGRNIKKKESCKFTIDYCAYFSSDNENLQASFNDAISELNDNGTMEKIRKAHLNGKTFENSKSNTENGTLTMLCDPHFDNRVYTDDNGEVVGMDVDIAREICNYLGYDLEIVTADFDEMFMDLDEGSGDFIISACEVTEEREEYYLLSDSYFTLNFYLIERK